MLQKLIKLVHSQHFQDLLYDGQWKSLNIDYHPPQVLRLYRDIRLGEEECRLYLHRILHTDEPCLYHKHRWPSAIYLLEGRYEMGISYNKEPIPPLSTKLESPTITTLVLSPGSGYEMLDPHGIHYVKPITSESLSVMISGPVFKDVYTKESKHKALHTLTEDQTIELLRDFKRVSEYL